MARRCSIKNGCGPRANWWKQSMGVDWWSNQGNGEPPTEQATDILFSSINENAATVSWTRGNGSNVLVVAKLNSYVDSEPVNGQSYTANSAFGSGSQLGTGNYVVYKGTGTSVDVTNLPFGVVIFQAYEFNGTRYLTDQATLNPKSVLVFSNEAKAVTDYAIAQTYTMPPLWNVMRDDEFIRYLVDNDEYVKIDQMAIIHSKASAEYALINVIAPGTRNLTTVSTIPFTELSGFLPNGTSSYLRTNYIPATHAVNYATDNSGIVAYTTDNDAASGTDNWLGACGAALLHAISVSVRFTGNLFVTRMNSAASSSVANSTTAGLYQWKRPSAAVFKVFKDSLTLVDAITVATGITDREIVVGAFNNNGTIGSFSAIRIGGVWMIGAAFTETIIKTAVDNLLAYSTPLSIKPVTGFSAWESPTDNDLDGFVNKIEELATNFTITDPANLTGLPPHIASEYLGTDSPAGGGTAYQTIVNLPNDLMMLVPATATTAVIIDTNDDTVTTFGTFAVGTQKWSGGYYCDNGLVPWTPFNATEIAVVDTADGNTVKFYDTTGEVLEGAGNLTGTQKWFCFKPAPDGWLYAIPYDATCAMRFHPVTKQVQFIDTTGIIGSISGNLTGLAKWDGGACWENLIIGATSTATDVLEITCHATTPFCTRVDNTFPVGVNKQSICIAASDGSDTYVYIWPYAGTSIAKYDPRTRTHTTIGDATHFTGGAAIKAGTLSILPDGKQLSVSSQGYATIFDPVAETLTKITDANYTGKLWITSAINSKGYVYCSPSDNTKILKQYYKNINFQLEENLVLSRYSHF